ncbi:MAG: ABC transporter ATP-binding protein/permease [Bdellovibrionaceae bacterium]|nr:ABC transporter ATP-binding protein/permease [Pseudobdellovibrionaceae bacterium]
MNHTNNDERMDRLPAELATKPFRFYFRRDPKTFGLGVGALFFTNLLDTLTPLAMGLAIDMIRAKNLDGLARSIAAYCALMVGVAFFRYSWRIYFGHFHQAVANDLRNRIFVKLTTLGPSFYQKNPIGKLMSLITNDVNSFRMAIGPGTLVLLDAAFLTLMILPVMLTISVDWTWKTMILLPFVPFLMQRMEKLVHERYRIAQDKLADVSAQSQEIISGIRVIKSYAQESNKRAAFNQISRSYEHAQNRVSNVDSGFEPLMDFAVAAGGAVLLWVCSSDVVRGSITLGEFFMFYQYINKMIWPMSAIGIGLSMVQQGRASFDRVHEVLRTETDIPDEGNVNLTGFESLEIRGLTYQYPAGHAPVLHDIHVTVRAGETIGIVGPVGAGKSTLMQLICRLYPVESGKILVNGHSLETIRLASLRQTVSFVTQDAFLFSDTIAQNVALGLDEFPGAEAVRDVTRAVNIDQEIETLPERFDAYLGERGVNLSGGQKQRLTIARALIRKAPVIILDDSLSAVDGNTEKAIVGALRDALSSRESRRQTTFLVSHRLATLKHADRIVVLSEGRVEAIGPHEHVLSLSPTYRRLHQLQSEEKLSAGFAAAVPEAEAE